MATEAWPGCCEHVWNDHDQHGCTVDVSTVSRTYERCHGVRAEGRTPSLDETRPDAPPLGPERPVMDLTCGRLIPPGHCGKPATWHFCWTDDAENGLCCDEHTEEAHRLGWGVDWHPVGPICTMPDSVWVGSIHSPPGRCDWRLSDGQQLRTAEVAHV